MPTFLAAVLLAAAGIATTVANEPIVSSSSACLTAGRWYTPAGEQTVAIAQPTLLDELARKRVVLLGERHDDADHHRWQLQVIAGLHAQRPDLVIGMEMLPRRAQPALDEWATGRLTEGEFLARTEWTRVWGFDPGLYLPILHFARINRIPVVALNVERAVVSEIASKGLGSVPVDRRESVGMPAAAGKAYRERLRQVFQEHGAGERAASEFDHFVEAQLFWDRAFAEALAAAARRPGHPLVIAITGSGHLANGDGVPRQLGDLGIDETGVLLPVEADTACRELPTGLAQAVFALQPPSIPKAGAKPLLGVRLEPGADGVLIAAVSAGSVADKAGLKAGDILREIAGKPVRDSRDVTAAVARQPPGTWLPVTVARNGGRIDLVAKFPPEP
ncbi:MAG: ChaN family lipoprotein [Burkholderiales bacterium]